MNLFVWLLVASPIGVAFVNCYQLTPWNTTDCAVVTTSCRSDFSDEDRCGHRVTKFCDHDGCNLRIAILLPNNTDYIVNAPQALQELQQAEEDARNKQLLPNRMNVTYKIFDDDCEQALASIGTVDACSQYCAHVIFGPICDYSLASSARIVKFMGSYGTPIITAGGFAFDFVSKKTSCDDEFFMLINSGVADYQSFSEFLYLTLAKHNWTHIALMYEKYDQNEIGGDQSCQLLMKTAIGLVKSIIPEVEYHDGDIAMLKVSYREYLRNTVGTKVGIIVMCMSHANTRKVLVEAEDLGMMDRGEYVFLNFDMYNNGLEPWKDANDSANNEKARHAYKSLLTFTPLIEAQNAELNATQSERPGSVYLDGIYDGFMLYLSTISEYLRANEDWNDVRVRGVDVVSTMFGKRITSKRGDEIVMNCNGQRVTSYALMQLGDEDRLHIVANYSTLDKRMHFLKDIEWVAGSYPPDIPTCGFDNSKCSANVIFWIVPIVCVLLVVAYRLHSKYVQELDLAAENWKINSHELIDKRVQPRTSMKNDIAPRYIDNDLVNDYIQQQQPKCEVLTYHMSEVVVKYFSPPTRIELGRDERMQLKKMKDLSHAGLVKFYGACLEIDHTCIVTEYCQRGSLLDVLQDGEIKLDTIFQVSVISDIVQGMDYLHNNDITHGALKSTNCLIDGHFAVKISDFGLGFIRQFAKLPTDQDEYCERLLWTAPELLRSMNKSGGPLESTKQADVYSFGIIVHEILVRKGPFYLKNPITKSEIVERVKRGPETENDVPLRPHFDEYSNDSTKTVTKLMKECWAEEGDDRPDFTKLKTMIREINRDNGNKGNLMDNLLNRMELYANNLESLVLDRTTDFLAEKKKCEDLLYQLLPKSVASQLISGHSVIAETFDQVTICFSDIVEFTKLSAKSTPLQVVDMLNDLYTCFDEVIGDFQVYKVETIGDAYLVVSGLPERNGNRHASEIARMSLRLMETVRKFKIRHSPDDPLKLRIGMHTGSCVAGVVGLKMPRYCLFGDTVNTASRMESNGLPLRIHVSADTKTVLESSSPPSFELECRGEIDIKGKGKMTTYWLIRELPTVSTSHATSAPACTTTTIPTSAIVVTTATSSSAKQSAYHTTNAPTANGKAKSSDLKRNQHEETVPLLTFNAK